MSREMINSGIEWIGSVPKSWKLERLQWHLEEVKESNNPIKTTQVLSLTNKLGVIPYEEKGEQGNKSKENLNEYKLAYPKTIVANSMNILIGSVGLSNYFGCVSPVYYVYKGKENSNIEFYNFLFQTREFQKELRKYANGILEIRLRVSSNNILKRYVPVPSKEEQEKIVLLLKEKISKIEELIANQEKQIALLEEEKVGFITKLIEEGLNNDLEPSLIKTVSKKPLHWKTTKLFNLLEMKITDGPHETPELFPEGIPFVSAEAIKNWTIDFDYIRGFISKEFYDYCCLKYVPRKNDIYVVKSGASTGKLGIVNTDKIFTIWSPLAVVRVDAKKAYYKFVFYALYSRGFQQQIQLGWSFGTQQNLGMRTLETLKIQYPESLEEQYKIVEFIDKKVSSIDRLIQIKKEKIEKLNEYKKSLIYEYVTGKREVKEG